MTILRSLTFLALFTSFLAHAEDLNCSGKGCQNLPIKGGNSRFLQPSDFLQEASCKGQGSRCNSTDECCEANDCMIGDQPYKTCGGG